MLQAIDLTCARGQVVLFRDLRFTLQRGGLLSVLGDNGTGKSTLLRLLSGLSQLETGRICWNGEDIAACREHYVTQVSYVGHRNALKGELTPVENLYLASSMLGQPLTIETAGAALDSVGLGRSVQSSPSRLLSEGQKRRVALARLWFCTAPLWVLDEPFTALDHRAAALFRERLNAHVREGGLVVMSTHQDIRLAAGSSSTLRLGP